MISPLSILLSSPLTFLVYIFSIVIAITVHECAHAWTAYTLGDDTPYLAGRVTLNPLAHIDPFGAIIFLLAGFGYGRPVVYNPMRLKRRSDELIIALAGPASNLLLAIFFNLIYFLQNHYGVSFINQDIVAIAGIINVSLAAFNMLPIPPLDGSSIIAYFWPEYRSLVGGQIGLVLILGLLIIPGALNSVMIPLINSFQWVSTLFGVLR